MASVGRDIGSMRVLDLGAGTGKLTALLAELGAEVTAVEPDPAMREELKASLHPMIVNFIQSHVLKDGRADISPYHRLKLIASSGTVRRAGFMKSAAIAPVMSATEK